MTVMEDRDMCREHAEKQKSLGNLSGARTWYEKALAACEAGYDTEKNAGTAHELIRALNDLGEARADLMDLKGAKELFDRALELSLGLAENDGSTQTFGDAADCYEHLGGLSRASGQSDEAKEYYRHVLEIRELLCSREETAASRRGLAKICEELAEIAAEEGNLSATLVLYEKDVEMREAAAAQTHDEADLKALRAAYERFGDLEDAVNEKKEASEWYAKALRTAEQTADMTGAAIDRAYLGLMNYKACMLLGEGSPERIGMLTRAAEIFAALAREEPRTAFYQSNYDIIRAELEEEL